MSILLRSLVFIVEVTSDLPFRFVYFEDNLLALVKAQISL